MPYNVEETGNLTRTASVAVPAIEYEQQLNTALRKLAGRVKVRGFRKGKVPLSVLRKQYGDSVQNDVLQDVVSRYVDEIVKKETLTVIYIDRPQLTRFDDSGNNGAAVEFRFGYELLPEIDPIGYIGIAVEKPTADASTAAIDAELERLREAHSTLEPIELRNTIKEGDVVTFDFEALDRSTVATKDMAGEDAQITIGDGTALPGMEEAMGGAAFDAEIIATVTWPEDSPGGLGGTTFEMRIKIKSVKKRVLPALDDDFAADTGEADTLLELRQKVRAMLIERDEHNASHYVENDLLARLVDQNPIELPPLFVQQEIDQQIRNYLRQMNINDMKGLNFEPLREGFRADVSDRIHGDLLLQAIASKENLKLEDADLQDYFAHQAMHMGATAQQLAKYYGENKDRWQQAIGGAIREKTVNHLLKQAEIKEIEWPTEEEMEARAEARRARYAVKAEATETAAEASEPPKKAKASKAKKAVETEATPETAPEATGDGSSEEAFSALKVDELKELLKANDLPVTGKKSDLVARLVEAGVKP